ncbi:hypothetical protein [Streptomyces yunnanensis]|uniref:Uncharacterized protein n=1 Tax=Streptomyces yunnanensis TaxID=156453 RepID=A0A9X8QS97_9ACTN|nr:hypothetical protein [Streptomyces yunnanensis]SHL74240.1 hypothetical protein SAMN05216268_10643 [Streptomyces yunnanensis]
MATPTSRDAILSEAVTALQEQAGRLSEMADEEMRRDLEEKAQVWHEAAEVVLRLIGKPQQVNATEEQEVSALFRLIYDPGVESLHDQLPSATSHALTAALDAACHDPIGHTAPRRGQAEEWNRQIRVDGALAMIFVSYSQKALAVVDIIDLS